MSLYNNKYRIESARLKGWDYKLEGSYFVTICTQDRDNLFGYVKNGNMVLNQFGAIVNRCWFDLPNHYQNIRLDAFVVMPNHVHGIMDYSNLFVPSKHFLPGELMNYDNHRANRFGNLVSMIILSVIMLNIIELDNTSLIILNIY